MLLSYSTWGMRTVPIDVAVAHCASLGFDGLELTVIPGWPTDAAALDRAARQRVRALYDNHGLALCGFSGNAPLLADDPTEAAEALARFRTYLNLAAEMQLPGERLIVTTTSGGQHGDWEKSRGALVERLGTLVEHAQQQGVMVGIEPHVATALHTPEQAIWVLEQVASPALTVHFDISHFNVQGMEMEETVALMAPYSLHTHIKDERGLWPDHEFLIPGEGEMHYVRYLRAMDRAGYGGHIVVEISLMVQQRPDYDPLAAAETTYRILSSAFREAGIARVPV
jgi:sugar phosphate isomerase/epimerase